MGKILNYKKFLEEIELNLQELGKVRSGEKRGDILVGKLKGDAEFTTKNNKNIKVDKMKDATGNWVEPEVAVKNITTDNQYDPDKAKNYFTKGKNYTPVFKDEEGDEFKLNQFKKTKEFGSSGAGRLVRQFESAQAIFIAIKQAYPDSYIGPSNLHKFFQKFVRLTKNLVHLPDAVMKQDDMKGFKIDENLIDDFLQDPDWVETFCRIPNKLWSVTGKFLDRNELYSIYHVGYTGGDSPFTHILNKYKELSKLEDFKDINITKYCPADVYLASVINKDSIISSIDESKSIEELTTTLNKWFDSKMLIPISLKKISGDFVIITNSEEGKDLPNFFIQSFIAGSDLRGISSKISTTSIWKHRNDKDVDVKDRSISFDSSDTSRLQDVDGEVEGSSSRHGKISFKAITRILSNKSKELRMNFGLIQTSEELSKLTIEELQTKVKKLIKRVEKIQAEIGGNLVKVYPMVRGTDISTNEKKLISRAQSLQIVRTILKLHLKNQKASNEVITKILRYALSIQTDKFSTPRYLRVI